MQRCAFYSCFAGFFFILLGMALWVGLLSYKVLPFWNVQVFQRYICGKRSSTPWPGNTNPFHLYYFPHTGLQSVKSDALLKKLNLWEENVVQWGQFRNLPIYSPSPPFCDVTHFGTPNKLKGKRVPYSKFNNTRIRPKNICSCGQHSWKGNEFSFFWSQNEAICKQVSKQIWEQGDPFGKQFGKKAI